ncbi:D-2-hydroxyglutarate dehydrogenase, mitochondrial [Condylostylus longicornis]|uniref:D-2-hydroxyglutarate dehydrogenase, mitochondrial n=1 Tax=Condylostylus longicornis TaxID=2530218 RepID=UPI00244DE194|nr:D-2-hydroxyglutarate dehydrogenase, mitochondrial [Condylostylus longicornis]
MFSSIRVKYSLILSSAKLVKRNYKGNHNAVELTKDRYKIKRNNYSVINDKDISFFENQIGKSYVVTNSDDIEGNNIDFLRSCRGNSQLLLKPKNEIEISQILKYCYSRNLAVCPQGGNTGLVGGSVPVFDEIIISLQRLNEIYSVDEITGIITCGSGCILENLENEAKNHGLRFPLDLGAKSTCQIGGNASTNAGGLRVIRYGSLHGSILGIETVLASGNILDLMSNFKKDNTGYHLKHLFIGCEGTLGIITKVAVLCPAISSSINVAFIALPSFEAVLKTFVKAKKYLGEILSACELIDEISFKRSVETFNLNPPISGYPFYMLIETSGSNNKHDEEKFNIFLNNGMENGEILDGTFTGEPGKISEIWKIRELVPVSLIEDGYCFKYDISLPLRDFYKIVLVMRERMKNFDVDVCGYGHIGDSNLHLNVACKGFSQDIYRKIEPFVFEYTSKLKGSVSAEHGIGFLKTKYLPFSKSDEAINLMRNIKTMLDPKNILNPYKVLPQE